jgi:hypothetical protein
MSRPPRVGVGPAPRRRVPYDGACLRGATSAHSGRRVQVPYDEEGSPELGAGSEGLRDPWSGEQPDSEEEAETPRDRRHEEASVASASHVEMT